MPVAAIRRADLEIPDGYVDIYEGARIFGVTHWTMRTFARDGLVESRKIAGKLMFDRDELNYVLNQVAERSEAKSTRSHVSRLRVSCKGVVEGRESIMCWFDDVLKAYAELNADERAALEDWEKRRDPATQASSEWPGFAAKIGRKSPLESASKNGKRPGK